MIKKRQGGGIETEAGKDMAKEKFQLDRDKADLNNDGELSEYEKVRGEAIQKVMDGGMENKMMAGGMMVDPFAPFQVTVGIDEHSGNEVPAGSKDEEVRDDIPAMLSEGEYVVPADVVRWHGLKTLEGLRCEAKQALGLMAMHDRISFVDEDTKEPVDANDKDADYEIEEKDKPEVEEAEVEVVKAQEGTDVQPADQTPTSYYQLQYRTNPQTGRTEMVYVDPLTNEVVSDASFEPERASRFTPENVLRREGLLGKEEEEVEEEEEDECPAGYVKDPDTGMCVPETITPDGGDGRDEQGPTGDVPYSEQLTTLAAERLGGLGADDLADYEGDTLAEQALSRMTDERGIGPKTALAAMSAGPLGMIGLGVKNAYDSIGAKRAAITRGNELQDIALGLDASALPQTYNLTFDPATASFKATTSSKITELQEREGGGAWATDYDHVGRSGKSYTSDKVFSDPEATEDVFNGIEDDLANITAVSGGGERNQFGDDEGNIGTSDLGGDSDFEGSRGVDEDRGPGGQKSEDVTSGYEDLAKGGYVSRKNKPRVSMINYSKGNK